MSGRILIVEDEGLLAFEMEVSLKEAGFTVVGCAGSLEHALDLLDGGCDVAVLDIVLRGESVEPVAMALHRAGVPLLFVSGLDRSALPAALQDSPLLSKPFLREDLVSAVQERLTAGRRQSIGAASA